MGRGVWFELVHASHATTAHCRIATGITTCFVAPYPASFVPAQILAYSPSDVLAMISFITSSVPPPIGPRRASRTARSMPYSRM